MSEVSKDAGVIAVLAKRMVEERLPKALAMKERVDKGGLLNDLDLAFLEQIVNIPITLFAYPNGKPGRDYSTAAVDVVTNAGYSAAVSTAWGASRHGDDPFQLRRFTPWRRTRFGFGAQLLANIATKPATYAIEPAQGARHT